MPASRDKFGFERAPGFHEKWVGGSYVVMAIFPTLAPFIVEDEIEDRIPFLYGITKASRKRKWPRGISIYILMPIYVADQFQPSTIAWVHRFHGYRWAILHEPVLYDKSKNLAYTRGVGRDRRADPKHWVGAAFVSDRLRQLKATLSEMALSYGHASQVSFNQVGYHLT